MYFMTTKIIAGEYSPQRATEETQRAAEKLCGSLCELCGPLWAKNYYIVFTQFNYLQCI